MFLINEQAVLLFALRVLFFFFCDKTSYAFKCNDKHTPLVTDIKKCHVCYCNMKSEHQNNKRAREICYWKLCERNLLTAKNTKFKIKKSYYEICWVNKLDKNCYNNIWRLGYMPNFVCLKQELSFHRAVCISWPSMWTQANRHINLDFLLMVHVPYVYECVGPKTYCKCRG